MITLTINGKVVQAEKDEILLKVINREGIDVPALCQHDAVEAFGACRLCMVEITKPGWDGWCDYVTSCLYPVTEGLIVNTHATKVVELRKSIVDLFLARHPNSEVIKKLAAEFGVLRTTYEVVVDGNNCILCALCTRICDAMGFEAISTIGRGHGKEVAPPLNMAPAACTGCLSCAKNCPTDYIEYTIQNGEMEIWGKKFEMIACKECGKEIVTKDFATHLNEKRNIQMDYYDYCDACHRNQLAGTMGKLANWEREAKQ